MLLQGAACGLLNALGATGIGLPLPQIPPALSKGVIDGVTLPYEIAPAVKTPDLVSHFSRLAGSQPRLGTNVFTFLMNKNSYEKLSAANRKVIDDNSGRNIAEMAGHNWDAIEEPGLKVVKSRKKNKFYTISRRGGCQDEGRRRAGLRPMVRRDEENQCRRAGSTRRCPRVDREVLEVSEPDPARTAGSFGP